MPAADLALIEDAAHAAADLALSYWRRAPRTWDKGGGQGPVSDADIAVDRLLRHRLAAARPDYGWLSEETEDDTARLAAERVFIVDPIDGTRTFLDGGRAWAHSLAVASEGRIVAAVVFLPALKRLYRATADGEATLNGSRLSVSGRTEITGARVLASRATFDPRHWPNGVPRVERHFRPSLAHRMCLVAEGRFDAMLKLQDSWEWDIAAGALIGERAGVRVTDRAGRPLRFNSAAGRSPGVVAAAPALHAALLPG